MAALILAMRLLRASLSLALSREVLVRGVRIGDTDAMLELDGGAVLLPAADVDEVWLPEPLTLRKTSIVIRLL